MAAAENMTLGRADKKKLRNFQDRAYVYEAKADGDTKKAMAIYEAMNKRIDGADTRADNYQGTAKHLLAKVDGLRQEQEDLLLPLSAAAEIEKERGTIDTGSGARSRGRSSACTTWILRYCPRYGHEQHRPYHSAAHTGGLLANNMALNPGTVVSNNISTAAPGSTVSRLDLAHRPKRRR